MDLTVSLDLQNELLGAVKTLGVPRPDGDAVGILTFAARLSPDDNRPPISTTRLFAGAVAIGQSGAATTRYPVALARAIKSDPTLSEQYQKILALFRSESLDAALQRLRPQWFSENVIKILTLAGENNKSELSGDEIVRAFFKHRNGLIYSRSHMQRVESTVKRLMGDRYLISTEPQQPTLMNELDAALRGISVPVTEAVRSALFRAAARRRLGSQLDVELLGSALVEDQPSTQRRITAPLAILSAAMGGQTDRREAEPPPIELAADGSNPLVFSPEIESLLRRGLSIQQRTFLNSHLGTKGLVAAILTTPYRYLAQVEPSQEQIDAFGETAKRFREIVRIRLADKPDQVQEWDRAFEHEIAPSPKLDNDQPGLGPARDKLGIANDALAIANVAAGQSTNLPLAFGIFGDWGSGKTFFMRLIHEQIARLVKSPRSDDGFERAIVQIKFNAWHYSESNLWASLVGHIFDELDRWMTRSEEVDHRRTADHILKRLATSRQLTLEATTELVQRRKEHAKATSELTAARQALAKARDDAAQAPITTWRVALNAVRAAILRDDELKQQLGSTQAALGVPKLLDDRAEVVAAIDEVQRSASATQATIRALRQTLGSTKTVTLGIVALIGVPMLLFGLQHIVALITGWDGLAAVGRGVEAVGGVLTMLAVLLTSFSGKLKSLTEKFAGLQQEIDREIGRASQAERANVALAEIEIAKSEAKVEQAKTVVQATGEQVAAALREYAEETGALRLRRFVRARAGAEGYGKHLGLVSTIRKDFDELESLMLSKEDAPDLEQARAHYAVQVEALIKEAAEALTAPEIDQLRETAKSLRDVNMPDAMAFRRIVLYIDDLDRCEPDKVVEVLQAVNMLLSFRLFVVIVAVDARWLSRSLETRYPDFFGVRDYPEREQPNGKNDGKTMRTAGNLAASRQEKGVGRATTEDYLEKIFQIPYWVPAMSAKTSVGLVGDLVAADRLAEKPGTNFTTTTVASDDTRSDMSAILPPDEDEQPRIMAPPSRALGLTSNEIEALRALSPYLGGSPRRARRFVNVYRVAKASLSPFEIKTLEDGEHRALATHLAIATGAPNAFGAWLAACESGNDELTTKGLHNLVLDEFERWNIEGALAKFRKMSGEDPLAFKRLAAQAGRASKFSFVFPSKSLSPGVEPQDSG
jgi:hypothetical protein